MRKILKSALLVACAVFSGNALAQESKPFGLTMGMSKQAIEKALADKGGIREGGKFHFYSSRAIEDSKFFTAYSYVVAPSVGVCGATGYSKRFASFHELKEFYGALQRALVSKYGRPSQSFNVDKGGENLALSLKQNKIMLDDFWGVGIDAHQQPFRKPVNNIVEQIHLAATPLGDSGIVSLKYEFMNSTKCAEFVAKDNSAGL